MEYVLFANGNIASKKAIEELNASDVHFRLVRKDASDDPLPKLLGPAGLFRGLAEIEFFIAGIAQERARAV